jgi:hypothetical protein
MVVDWGGVGSVGGAAAGELMLGERGLDLARRSEVEGA